MPLILVMPVQVYEVDILLRFGWGKIGKVGIAVEFARSCLEGADHAGDGLVEKQANQGLQHS